MGTFTLFSNRNNSDDEAVYSAVLKFPNMMKNY